MLTDVKIISDAIKSLRDRLGETQEGMARRLGCPLSSYVRWEKGRSEPGGMWVLAMLSLCPDADCLRAFGLAAQPLKSPILSLKSLGARGLGEPVKKDGRQGVDFDLGQCRTALAIIADCACAGSRAAREVLRSEAERLARVADAARTQSIYKEEL